MKVRDPFEIDYTTANMKDLERLFNYVNETKAPEKEIRLLFNELRGKSGVEHDSILDIFCEKYKAVSVSRNTD